MANQLFWAYVGFTQTPGGKTRPVLYLRQTNDFYVVFRLTSRYANKSDFIKSKYVPITHWKAAGLSKPSWIDTVKTYQLPIESTRLTYIGQLTAADMKRLTEHFDNEEV